MSKKFWQTEIERNTLSKVLHLVHYFFISVLWNFLEQNTQRFLKKRSNPWLYKAGKVCRKVPYNLCFSHELISYNLWWEKKTDQKFLVKKQSTELGMSSNDQSIAVFAILVKVLWITVFSLFKWFFLNHVGNWRIHKYSWFFPIGFRICCKAFHFLQLLYLYENVHLHQAEKFSPSLMNVSTYLTIERSQKDA